MNIDSVRSAGQKFKTVGSQQGNDYSRHSWTSIAEKIAIILLAGNEHFANSKEPVNGDVL